MCLPRLADRKRAIECKLALFACSDRLGSKALIALAPPGSGPAERQQRVAFGPWRPGRRRTLARAAKRTIQTSARVGNGTGLADVGEGGEIEHCTAKWRVARSGYEMPICGPRFGLRCGDCL
jgi:hypothetical protein